MKTLAVAVFFFVLTSSSDILAVPRGVPKIKQTGKSDCTPTAAASALQYWKDHGYGDKIGGKDIKTIGDLQDKLTKDANTSGTGTSGAGLNKALAEILENTNLRPKFAGGKDLRDFTFLQGEWDNGEMILIAISYIDDDGKRQGHLVTLNDLTAGDNANERNMEYMDPADGEYHQAKVKKTDTKGCELQTTYGSDTTACITGIVGVSPDTKVSSAADKNADGSTTITYTFFSPTTPKPEQRIKDFHIFLDDDDANNYDLTGLPAQWQSAKVEIVGGRLVITAWDDCHTNGLPDGTPIKLKYKGPKKVEDKNNKMLLTNDGKPDLSSHVNGQGAILWTHCFAVIAMGGGGKPEAPGQASLSPTHDGVAVSWDPPVTGAQPAGYAVFDEMQRMIVADTPATSWVRDSIESNRLYCYSLATRDTGGGYSWPGERVSFYVDSSDAQFTSAGTDVTVHFIPSLSTVHDSNTLNVHFFNVADTGQTVVSYFYAPSVSPPIGPPGTMQVIQPYYNISTSAQAAGPVGLSVPYDSLEYLGAMSQPHLFHLVSGFWMDVTQGVDLQNRVVQGLSNNGLGEFALAFQASPIGDVGAVSFGESLQELIPDRYVRPSVIVKNFGPALKSFTVVLDISDQYADSEEVRGLYPGMEREVEFASFVFDSSASYPLRAFTVLQGDNNPSNDTLENTTVGVYDVNPRWNMVSVPLSLLDYSKQTVYPTAKSPAFAYDGAYTVRDTLAPGIGYWVRFDSAASLPMAGAPVTEDTFDVVQGWNLIGSISSPLAATDIGSDPGGIRTSNFFGYSGSYAVVDSIRPGQAYWVKVTQDGKLILSASHALSARTRIRISPDAEMPPAPPAEPARRSLTAEVFALEQNFPNPFNPRTHFQFSIADVQYVTLKVYNLLGQEVAALVNETKQPGEYSVEWDASGAPSGVYYCRLQAGSFVSVKKLVLIR